MATYDGNWLLKAPSGVTQLNLNGTNYVPNSAGVISVPPIVDMHIWSGLLAAGWNSAQGASGPTGAVGGTATTGTTGTTGVSGSTGAAGPLGVPGAPTGVTGSTGATGWTGPAGL